MGQEPGTGGSAVAQSSDPEHVREQIEETRLELGETVEALAAKTDVKARAKRKVHETKSTVASKLGKARDVSPDSAVGAAAHVSETAQRNPLPLAAAGAFLAGLILGRTTRRAPRRERPALALARRKWPRR